jgi:hypothetical protein
MAPWNATNINDDPLPSAALTHVLVTRSHGSGFRAKTGVGIIFALGYYLSTDLREHDSNPRPLACFAVITGVFLAKRRHDALNNRTSPWLGMRCMLKCFSYPIMIDLTSERLNRMVPSLHRRTQPEATPVNENREAISLHRQPTFPPLASRSSTFDQNLPAYATQDPLSRNSQISTIGEDVSGEVS